MSSLDQNSVSLLLIGSAQNDANQRILNRCQIIKLRHRIFLDIFAYTKCSTVYVIKNIQHNMQYIHNED